MPKPEPVRRGGRVDPALVKQEAEEKARAVLAEQHQLADVRALMQLPAFHRFMKHWIAEAGTFGVIRLFTAEGYWLQGRRELGVQMWNQLLAADPTKVVEMLDLTKTESLP